MTVDPRMVIVHEIISIPGDPAFRREWLDRGGSYQVFRGDPEKQAQWKRELPLRYVVTKQMERVQ